MDICHPTMRVCCDAMQVSRSAMRVNRPAMDIRRRTMDTRQRTFFPGIEIFCHVSNFSGKEEGMRLLNSGFTELTPEDFYDKGTFIHTQLTGNTYYPTTTPTLAAIQTLLTPLDTALKMPKGLARDGAIATARPPLEEALQDLAENLEQATPGNLQKLSTTGFDLRKTPVQSSEPPATPGNLRLRNLPTSGEVQFLFDASDRAKSYQIQTTDDPNSGVWKDYDPFSSTRAVVAKGLPRAKDVWGRVRAIGPNNTKSAWSDPATVLVT
jgi:hypothetical protein